MEYLNDSAYKRGEEVRIEVEVDAETVTKEGKLAYGTTVADLYDKSGYRIRLWGGPPEIDDDVAKIVLTGIVGDVGNGIYRNRDGVLGKVPGDTVRYDRLSTLTKPLKVEGEVENSGS